MNKQQSGLSVLILVMAAVIVGLLGLVGWLTWSKVQVPASTISANNQSQITAGANSEKLVAEFYEKYTSGNYDSATLIKQYGTARLAAAYNDAGSDPHGTGSDPILCAQAVAPVSILGHKIGVGFVDVYVDEYFDTPRTVTATVLNGKIDRVVCPQQ